MILFLKKKKKKGGKEEYKGRGVGIFC